VYEGYLKYNGGMPAPAPELNYNRVSQGLKAVSGASAALPWVSAGLQGAGLLASLYGGYKQQEAQEKAYRDQMREFERQKAIEEDDRKRRIEAEAYNQQVNASQFGSTNDRNRMSQYAPYFAQIGR
jgi:hypothetical protein